MRKANMTPTGVQYQYDTGWKYCKWCERCHAKDDPACTRPDKSNTYAKAMRYINDRWEKK